jgi:uncharacterized membrane protein
MAHSILSHDQTHLHVDISSVPLWRPFLWLARGWRDMSKHWGASIGYGLLIVALGWTLLVFCATHPYFIAAAISGFLLIGPIMSTGLAEMSRRQGRGERADFDASLEGFARNRSALFEFCIVLGILAVVWFGVSAILLGTIFKVPAPSVQETMYLGFIDTANRLQIEAYFLVGAALAVVVFVISVVTIPLIIDRQATAADAMRASARAVLANLPAMVVWSALLVVLTVIGFAPLLLGMALVAPWLGHATWHAYRDMVR